jgi:hypothetical protein
MKKLLIVAGLFVLSTTAFAQMKGIKVSSPVPDVQTQTEAQKDAIYKQLIGKDITAAMKAFNMKDSIGKTSYAYIPQVEKGTRYLLLKVPNGDQLAFKNNTLAAILPKQ